MTVQVQVQAKPEFQSGHSVIKRACNAVLEQLEIEEGSLSVVLTDDDTIHKMNLTFAGEDHATDVLSFPAGDPDPDSGILYLGDIIIAVPIAQQQSVSKGHSLEDELGLLAVHGTLHLLGFNHAENKSRKEMWEIQGSILSQLGIDDISWINQA